MIGAAIPGNESGGGVQLVSARVVDVAAIRQKLDVVPRALVLVAEALVETTTVVPMGVEAEEAEVVAGLAVASRVGAPTVTRCVAILGGIARDSLSLLHVVMRLTDPGFCSLGLIVSYSYCLVA